MASSFDKNNPFAASLIDRRRLSSPASQKDTQHFSVSLVGSGLTYACGDSLGVFPVNNPAAVTELLKAAGFSGDEPVTLPKDAYLILTTAGAANAVVGVADFFVEGVLVGAP